MKTPARAWIAISGDELLRGDLVDANGPFLAKLLDEHGIEATRFVGVGDDIDALVGLIREAEGAADWLFLTGGLGSTKDDLTREAAAMAFDRPLVENADAIRQVEGFWRSLGRDPSTRGWPEAVLPEGVELIENPRGLAPGFVLTRGGFRFAAFPGVPAELRSMAPNFLAPHRAADFQLQQRELRLAGVAESVAAERLADLLDRGREPLVGIAAKDGYLRLSFRARGAGAAEALRRDIEQVEALFGDRISGRDGGDVDDAVARILIERGETLVVSESLSGGLIGHRLTEIAGISDSLLADLVCYSNEAKESLLGVPGDLIRSFGAVSEEVARAMAEGARVGQDADWGISTTGIAGPSGGSATKPVGTVWVAVAHRNGRVLAEHRVHPGGRSEIKSRAANHALDLLRRALISG